MILRKSLELVDAKKEFDSLLGVAIEPNNIDKNREELDALAKKIQDLKKEISTLIDPNYSIYL